MVDAGFTVQLARRACEAPCDKGTQGAVPLRLFSSDPLAKNKPCGQRDMVCSIDPLIRFRMSRCRVSLSTPALCHDAALVEVGCGGHRKDKINGIWWDLAVVQTERERPWPQDVTGARGMISRTQTIYCWHFAGPRYRSGIAYLCGRM